MVTVNVGKFSLITFPPPIRLNVYFSGEDKIMIPDQY